MPRAGRRARAQFRAKWRCGYTLEEAQREAERCLLCPTSRCMRGCPVGIDIPGFIQKASARRIYTAPTTSSTDTNLLPAVCGRVCPQENQCEGVCTVGESLEPVAIGRLERFVGDLRHRRGLGQHPLYRAERLSCRHRRLRSRRHGLRRRHGQGRLRRHRLRGLPPGRRRAAIRHPRIPSAQQR